MRMGEQISNMAVGALIDTGLIEGKGDVKADINVKRVLSRVLAGEDLSIAEIIDITRRMHPKNPWLLDRELYLIGKELCFESISYCDDCYLSSDCAYTKLLVYEDEAE
jgi:adenine-specific DNA glycosylase